MYFASDNAAPVHPRILEAIAEANHGHALPYGNDPFTRQAKAALSELFETEIELALVPTGTAANALSLSLIAPPVGTILCRDGAHIETSEAGGPVFYTGGARLLGVPGQEGRIVAADVEAAFAGFEPDRAYSTISALSLTQATEAGTVYTLQDVRALAAIAREHGARVHMDGSRFANALVTLGCSPADLSWKAGIDVLSFGTTKNGTLASEAVVVFDPALARGMRDRSKRGGLVLSKHRFAAAQMSAYVENGLWLELASTANAQARALAAALRTTGVAVILHAVEANEVFVRLPAEVIDALEAAGAMFYRREAGTIRLVTSYATTAEEIEAFAAAVRAAAEGGEG